MQASVDFHRPWLYGWVNDRDYDALLRRAEDPRSDINLLVRESDGAILGFFNLSEIARGFFQSAYLGYGAVAEYAGQGYMSRGMQLLLRKAFEGLKLHRVEANIQPGNANSLALVQRAGFVKEGFSPQYLKIGGEWRDHERWAIREEMWRARFR